MSYIVAIETAVPDYLHRQEDITSFYCNSTDEENNKRKIRIVSKKSGINTRHSVVKDFSVPPEEFEFFSRNKELLPEPNLSTRMAVYNRTALKLCLKAVNKIQDIDIIKRNITHLITVTCTGMFAPGLDIDLIRDMGLDPTINRTSVNFMGCNAAILALKQADMICRANPKANVLIVSVELCTIHFQKKYSDDYILSNLIFSDGAAAVIISNEEKKIINNKLCLKMRSFYSLIAGEGYKDMAWQLSENGFMMNLSSYVSELIKGKVQPILNAIDLDKNEIDYWAIHPGGKKIIDDFASALQLDTSHFNASYEVLKNYGNMSSPTILFVLKYLIENASNAVVGQTIFAAGFGPGLSIETLRLQYV